MKIRPGKTTLNTLIHLASANIKVNRGAKTKKRIKSGMAKQRVIASPAVMIALVLLDLFSARYLVMNRETVIGVPEQEMVRSRLNTDSAT